jgi:hypothetical protein
MPKPPPSDPRIWVVMPVLAHPAYTEAAISDVLAQTLPCRLLVINQGVDTAFRTRLERIAEDSDRLFLWSHQPPLPSLAATWNRALRFAWASGAERALVVNNDVRLAPNTLEQLDEVMRQSDALVVTGVGVSKPQFTPGQMVLPVLYQSGRGFDDCAWPESQGGPDFSCFLISQSCHWRFPFDEQFIPAYCEEVDFHRRLMLAGEGRRIFGVNVPYLHYGSTTLKTVDAKTRERIERQTAAISREYYARKWGGPVNEERYRVPFDRTDCDHATTPELLEEVRDGEAHRRLAAERHADRDRGDADGDGRGL